MSEQSAPGNILQRKDFDQLFVALRECGYETVGPTVKDAAIVLAPITSTADLPIGWTDRQSPGRYELVRTDDARLFGYAVGPTSAKRWLFPPRRTLWRARKVGHSAVIEPCDADPPRTAILGMRACDLQAILIQDRVFLGGPYRDSHYQAMRDRLFLIAVDCERPAATCFCTSMGGSPAAEDGFDLRLTELADEDGHRFWLEPGTVEGRRVLEALPTSRPTGGDKKARQRQTTEAVTSIKRRLNTDGLRELLYRNAEHPRWREVGERCLACGNCTSSCPTCFCSNVEEVTDLVGDNVKHDRVWDSCFNLDFSYIHGGGVRLTTMSRYRQWMTHKLSAWHDQFGTSGCVGCGRCITWCPAAIDITEEARAIRETEVDASTGVR